jgi:hypothetical protein
VDDGALLAVDFVRASAHGRPGRLGLTGAPGRWRPGRDPASDRLLAEDLARLQDHFRARTLVTLLEEREMADLGLPRLRAAVVRAGLESLWLPVSDRSEPPSLEDAAALSRRILDRLDEGATVVVHCRAGLGRSGTIAACCLVAAGRTASMALRLVRSARPGAVETPGQARFVERLAEALRAGDLPPVARPVPARRRRRRG